MRTVPARHIVAAGASVLVMAAGAFTVPAAAGVAGDPARGARPVPWVASEGTILAPSGLNSVITQPLSVLSPPAPPVSRSRARRPCAYVSAPHLREPLT